MSIKLAKEICDLQGIKMHREVMVLCPQCGRKTLKLDITENEAECIRCHKEYNSINKVLEIVQADFVENHKGTDIEMRSNRGQVN